MVSFITPKKGVEYITYISLPAQTGNIMQANPTIEAGDFKVSKDGDALADLTTLPTVTPVGGKMLKITLTATEMTADNITVIASDVAGAEWNDVSFNVQTTANQIDDLATQATVDTILTDTNELQVNQGNWVTATGFSTFDPAVDTVATVTTVTNMRGTDNANTVAPDNASIAFILTDTGTTIPAQITALNDISTAQVATELATYDAPTKAELDAGFAGLNDIASTDIVTAGAITTLAGAVVNVDLVDVTTTNADMRGTDSANTVAPDNATISTITGQITALNDITVANVLDGVIEGTTTLKQSLQISNSATGAKLSGAATNTIAVRDLADTKDRITATVDADGNRTAVTRSLD